MDKPERQRELENLVKEIGDATATSAVPGQDRPKGGDDTTSSSSKGPSASTTEGSESFQETIQRTIRRMQDSGEQATTAVATSFGDDLGDDDMLAELLKQLQNSSGGGGGENDNGTEGAMPNEEEFSKILIGMMEQLTNKEILYEPMKELNEKFPAWLEANRSKVTTEESRRYEEQRSLVAEIVARFDRPGYADANPDDREYIVERMQKVR